MSIEQTSVYNKFLLCDVISLEYNFISKGLILYLEKNNCVGMSEVIAYAKSIDPDVKQIKTFAGSKSDMCYILVDGTWKAQEFK